ncbi:AraC family transcriptional regulator [Adhaeribacter arboris]|uniref:AraC family transcriptional regulator n=1 Tax=Adhaeribacter arboris TaxID=2072846 RepID=A0A2T2YEW6_9BACT|nr:AraC family transcriptional regulator [Adhaeribacter arboris]PSR54056.1 AraC family transcriptional regulator [Adhaeribacter arboris]
MHPLYLKKNTKSFEQSFQMQHARVPHTYDTWHCHQELELNAIIKGTGTRFIGDHVGAFSDGDMVLVGSNLPHVWKNDKEYYQGQDTLYAELMNFFFLEDFAGKELFQLPELQPIQNLLQRASQGIRIYGKTSETIQRKMKKIFRLTAGERVITLMQILNIIAHSDEVELLASPGFINSYQANNTSRINKVYDFIMNNFLEEITLEQVAEVASMNVTAFCRYFKRVTKKSFVQFLNEIRIGYACKLLLDEKLTVSQICYESGFNNLSNFNKHFKAATKHTPQHYKLQHQSSVGNKGLS